MVTITQKPFQSFYLSISGNLFFKIILNILPSLIKVFIMKNFPTPIINWLRKYFASGRFIR